MAALNPFRGDERHPVHRITATANHRTQRRVFQARQTADGDVVGGDLVRLQAAALRAEREKPPHGHGHARLHVERPENHARGILEEQVFDLEAIVQREFVITGWATGQVRIRAGQVAGVICGRSQKATCGKSAG